MNKEAMEKAMKEAMEETDFSFYEYDGMVMSTLFSVKSLDRIKETVLDDEDILVAAFPKCGTTWMQQIVFMIHHDGDVTKADDIPTIFQFSFIEADIAGYGNEYDKWAAGKPRRLVKSYLGPKFFEKTLSSSQTKIMTLLRNPKDALVSYFHFYRMNVIFNFSGDWDDFFELFKEKNLVYGDIFDVQMSWWKLRDDPRIEVFKYEDMLKSPEEAVRRVMKHMGKSLSDEIVQKIVQETSFESMKDNPLANYSTVAGMRHEISPFIRKGKVGDWKNYFSAEQAAYVDRLSAEVHEPNGLFLEDE